MSDNRFTRRYLLRRGDRKNLDQVYIDNRKVEYDYKWAAILSSFVNFFGGCLKNGFPVVVKRLWYSAWAFYPFFFVRGNIQAKTAIQVLNHERIHIRQQRELHIVFSIPLIILSFWYAGLLVFVPFVPTLFYLVDFVRVWNKYVLFAKQIRVYSASDLRKLTCFETEANNCMLNADYLLHRKFFSFLNYR